MKTIILTLTIMFWGAKSAIFVVVIMALLAGVASAWDYHNDRDRRDPNVMILNPDSGAVTPGLRLGDSSAAPILDVTTGRVVIPTAPMVPGMVLDLSGEKD